MKIQIVGGGPAGLFLAIAVKRRFPRAEIAVHEKRPRENTFGFGIAFTSDALETLRAGDDVTAERVAARVKTWHSLDFVHQTQRVSFAGRTYHGLARIALLEILQKRALELGVALAFEERVADPRKLARKADLLVGADGFGSAVRKAWEKQFQPSKSLKANYHVWYGVKQRFPGVSLVFRANGDGLFIAHAYAMDDETSTFIVDCETAAWKRAGLGDKSDEEARAYFEELFRADLGGEKLLSNDSRWIHYAQLRCKRWTHDKIALLGDAAHTIHFSGGAGTSLALADALSLVRALEKHAALPAALQAYEAERKPFLDQYQDRNEANRKSLEGARDLLHLAPVDFAATLITGGHPVLMDDIRREARVSDAFAATSASQ